jgi:hypothetical protein
MKADIDNTFIDAAGRVETHLNFGFEVSVESVTAALEEHGAGGRMMGDLFAVDGAAVDEGLIGLSKNWVKRFVHTDVDDGGGDAERDDFFEALNYVGAFDCLL